MKIVLYIWAGPTTMIGIPLVFLSAITGGNIRIRDGVLQAHGRAVGFLLQHCTLLPGGAAAITMGHIVLAQNQETMDRAWRHELIHVRQVERWGPFFIPLYLLLSLIAKFRGLDAYRDNPFERVAFDHS